jgi:hypothetical protein
MSRIAAFPRGEPGDICAVLRALAIAAAVALIVFAVSGGHVLFLPLLFVPLGLFGFGHRRNRRSRFFL